jgi:hypothetical protein
MRFLVAEDERGHRCGHDPGVDDQQEARERARLPENDRQDRQVHGVADVAIETADNEAVRRCHRRGCAGAFPDEPAERVHQHRYSRAGNCRPEHPYGYGVGRNRAHSPCREPPGNPSGEEPRTEHEEGGAAKNGSDPAHVGLLLSPGSQVTHNKTNRLMVCIEFCSQRRP